MLKRVLILIPLCILLAAMVSGVAAGGADDPLVTLSYLTGTFSKEFNAQLEQKLNDSDSALLKNMNSEVEGDANQGTALNWAEQRVKKGDILIASQGTNVMILAGVVRVDVVDGTVVNATTGEEVRSGSLLDLRNRYIVAEDTTAFFEVISRTAVMDYLGSYLFVYSAETDYTAISNALKSLGLFKGSNTGYGSGFDLEDMPSRLQAIIMFVRIMGEEEEALAWTGGTHFKDITPGTLGEKYVGYAYSKGYTGGYSDGTFRPSQKTNARQYVEFVLRAMGYSSIQPDLSQTMKRAVKNGVLTQAEADFLESETFLRADLAYVSFAALKARLPNTTQTLAQQLQQKGAFTAKQWQEALKIAAPK